MSMRNANTHSISNMILNSASQTVM